MKSKADTTDAVGGWGPGADATLQRRLLEIARGAIETHLAGVGRGEFAAGQSGGDYHGAFVTLKSKGGALRGCIGQIGPVVGDLGEFVAEIAVASATRDHRFPPVRPPDLADLRVEISLLSRPEPAPEPQALNPAVDGVIVKSGDRQGVLLPGIEGVDSAAMQLGIARRKAGISPDERVDVQRFSVVKFHD